jgi:alpha-glucosidase (family GH31 glycosyl hydrolase)
MFFSILLVSLALGLNSGASILPSRLAGAAYPEWAHYHLVWLAPRESNQTSNLALVHDYIAHNIIVGGLNIDSEWSTGDSNFIWDTNKFPNSTEMVSEVHALGVRVMLWVTSLIDNVSSNYKEALAKGYLVSKGKTGETSLPVFRESEIVTILQSKLIIFSALVAWTRVVFGLHIP